MYQTTPWWQATTGVHIGRVSAICLHCQSRRVGIYGFHSGGSCVAWPRAPSTTSSCARTTLARPTRTASELLNHLDGALAEAQHVWRIVRDGIKPPAPQADASLHPRPGRRLTPVDRGDDEHPGRQRMHAQKIITSPCEGLIENPLAIMLRVGRTCELNRPGDSHQGPVLDTDEALPFMVKVAAGESFRSLSHVFHRHGSL